MRVVLNPWGLWSKIKFDYRAGKWVAVFMVWEAKIWEWCSRRPHSIRSCNSQDYGPQCFKSSLCMKLWLCDQDKLQIWYKNEGTLSQGSHLNAWLVRVFMILTTCTNAIRQQVCFASWNNRLILWKMKWLITFNLTCFIVKLQNNSVIFYLTFFWTSCITA